MFQYALADRLKKTRAEIGAMPASELDEWQTYFRITGQLKGL